MLSLLSDIRNRSFHWESLIKIRENGYPRLSTNEYNLLTSIEADKIEIFFSAFWKKFINKNLGGTSPPSNFDLIVS